VCWTPAQLAAADRSDEFEVLWGHKFAPTRQRHAQGDPLGPSADPWRLVETAAERSEVWLALALYGLGLAVAVGAGPARAYHALTSLGLVGGLLAFRHATHPPRA
jgi:hypothetical protein